MVGEGKREMKEHGPAEGEGLTVGQNPKDWGASVDPQFFILFRFSITLW